MCWPIEYYVLEHVNDVVFIDLKTDDTFDRGHPAHKIKTNKPINK